MKHQSCYEILIQLPRGSAEEAKGSLLLLTIRDAAGAPRGGKSTTEQPESCWERKMPGQRQPLQSQPSHHHTVACSWDGGCHRFLGKGPTTPWHGGPGSPSTLTAQPAGTRREHPGCPPLRHLSLQKGTPRKLPRDRSKHCTNFHRRRGRRHFFDYRQQNLSF